jgi:CHAT domain-containing protein
LTQPQPVTAAEVQTQCLDSQTILLEYQLGEKRSWLWAITPEAITGYGLPPRADIETSARKIYELLTARQSRKDLTESQRQAFIDEADAKFRTESAALSRTLFGPISIRLRQEWKGKRLVIVASGALQYAPFAALPPPEADGQMIANHEIVYIPSASALAELRRETADRKPAAKTLAVIADPVFEPDDPRVLASVKKKRSNDNLVANIRSAGETPAKVSSTPISPLARSMRSFSRTGFSRLPFSREEAEEIAELIPERAMFKATDFQANRTLATSGELGRYRIIHFATHGLLNSEHPELSGLVLSLVDENGKPQDGFLRMDEIFNLRLPADLVVLSACQTALGKEIKGEGLVGLTRGFMYAGARRVVASLWQVDDQATSELMRLFYRGMLKEGLRPAAALREAQIGMSRSSRWSSPYYWAGFVIQGEWR